MMFMVVHTRVNDGFLRCFSFVCFTYAICVLAGQVDKNRRIRKNTFRAETVDMEEAEEFHDWIENKISNQDVSDDIRRFVYPWLPYFSALDIAFGICINACPGKCIIICYLVEFFRP